MYVIDDKRRQTMPWKCLDCGAKFDGPLDRAPAGGCAVCGSRKIFDCNVDVVVTGFKSIRLKQPSITRHLNVRLIGDVDGKGGEQC